MTNEPKSAVEDAALEARLIEQDHRLPIILLGFLTRRPKLARDDPRRDAYLKAIVFNVFSLRSATTAGIGLVSILSLALAWQANSQLEEQNRSVEVSRRIAAIERIDVALADIAKARADFAAGVSPPPRRIFPSTDEAPFVCNGDAAPLPTERNLENFDPALQQAYGRAWLLSNVLDDNSEPASAFGFLRGAQARRSNAERGYFAVRYLDHSGMFLGGQTPNFSRAELNGVRITGRQFRNVDLSGANFGNVELQAVDFVNVSIDRASFDDAFVQACFRNVTAHHANFSDANLSGTIFFDIELEGAQFANARLNNVMFGAFPAVWESARFANFEGAIVCSVEVFGAASEMSEKERRSTISQVLRECGQAGAIDEDSLQPAAGFLRDLNYHFVEEGVVVNGRRIQALVARR